MSKLIKIIKKLMITLVCILITFFIFGFSYMHLSPQFGGSLTEQQLRKFETLDNFKDGEFQNIGYFELNLDINRLYAIVKKSINAPKDLSPDIDIKVDKVDLKLLRSRGLDSFIIWLGHSSFYIQLGGKKILLDPVFSSFVSPHPWLGPKRYSKDLPISIEQLNGVDLVIISHDHYDHLDYHSIKQLIPITKKFLVPLGVGNHLYKWGAKKENVVELNWWEEIIIDDQKFIFTPSQHMSGRGLTDHYSTLWGSWVIEGVNNNIFFSGDTGYGPHFAEIGEKFGPFDLALMESGQYDDLWPYVHLMPEQTVLAAQELNAKLIVPIHWGAFTLANHSWIDPIIRVTKEANMKGVNISTPRIGEPIVLDESNYPRSRWWELFN